MNDLQALRKEHEDLLEKWSFKYQDSLIANGEWEFTVDGPSDWPKYWQRHPRIAFLLKESHADGWHPSVRDTMEERRFSINVTLWKYAIRSLYQNPTATMDFPDMASIHDGDHSDVAFVEVKKLNQGKPTSDDNEITVFARKDKEFLKKQIDLIDPQIVLCAGTIDSYDAIYEEKYKPCVVLSSLGSCKCWHLSNRLVIAFIHPSYWAIAPEELYRRLCLLIAEGKVFEKFAWSKWFSPQST